MTTQTPLRIIPLNQLHRSPLNARKTGGTAVEELAASIATGGLIQNLVVIPEKNGKKAGFGVVAGGRRLAALQSLVRAKIFEADIAIPCKVITAEEATELSLAENIHRENMHPADQFEAFAQLVDDGKSAEDIAARHGITTETVRKRLMLGRVSPVAMKLYRDEAINLDQVMALTLSDDHDAQEALLKGRRHYPTAYEIRRALTDTAIPATDVRAKFIGEKAYIVAGGFVRRDLFDERNGAYFENSQLVEQLVAEKLERAAERLRKDFAWVDIFTSRIDYSDRSKYGSIPTIRNEPDAKTAKKLEKLHADLEAVAQEMQAIESGPESEESDEVWSVAETRYDAIKDKINEVEKVLHTFDPEAVALAGAIIGIGYDGKIEKHVNLIRPEDKAKLRKAKIENCDDASGNDDNINTASGDPQSVRTDLSTYLTAITQEALADNVQLALRALAYQLALRWIDQSFQHHGVSISATDHADLPVSDTLAGSALAKARDERRERWETQLPKETEALWAWCQAADDTTIAALLAYSTARTLTGVQFGPSASPILPLVQALSVNVADHWQPNASYFKRIKKATTLEVLAAYGHFDRGLAKAKRDALADRAEQLLAGSGWLAPTLRPQPCN